MASVVAFVGRGRVVAFVGRGRVVAFVGRSLLLSPVTAQPHTGQSRAKWGTEAGWKVTNNDAILPPNLLRCSTDFGLPRVDTTGNQTVCELDSNGLKISNIGKKNNSCLSCF